MIALTDAAQIAPFSTFDPMNTKERKRIDTMWTITPSSWFARFVLSAGLVFAVTNALGYGSVKSAVIPVAPKASWVGQGGVVANQPTAPSDQRVSDDYIIGPSDVLAINVWKDPELTRNVPVRPDGKISLPLIGEMQVSGLTALDVQRLVTQRLKEYVAKPEVTVIVQEVKSRTYIIVGKIAKPGSFGLSKPTTVLEAIAIAGGFQEFAKVNKVYILRRQDDGSQIRLRFEYKKVLTQRAAQENVDLKNGDTIVVP
jgi:polysaccharide export outer membrane protein